jgi:hypothetical protein
MACLFSPANPPERGRHTLAPWMRPTSLILNVTEREVCIHVYQIRSCRHYKAFSSASALHLLQRLSIETLKLKFTANLMICLDNHFKFCFYIIVSASLPPLSCCPYSRTAAFFFLIRYQFIFSRPYSELFSLFHLQKIRFMV